MTALSVKACGPMTSIQDSGRFGWQRYGVSSSGAMDRLALAAANALVGNGPGAAAIEFMLMGGTFEAQGGSVRIAVAGAPCAVTLDGRQVLPMSAVSLSAGEVVTVGPAQSGVYAYLAASGGFALNPQLGSLSLQPRAGIGGLGGRALQAGDLLPLILADAPDGPELALDPVPLDAATVRIVLGPQDDYFTKAGIETFLSSAYTVSREADRMGYRLTGPKIAHARGFNIVSDGIVTGSVQVPGSGEPIVMMADRQTTGGYPKLATVISADLRLVAQRRSGEAIRFAAVSIEEAQALARERAEAIRLLPAAARPLGAGLPATEALLGLNLAGEAVDAFAAQP
ncbi:MAG TPA: biotin-dependent carboxyltransferase family protein [Beijerinckiaceae bacterium]|nr:biotin-dependent carboxyltransferase family protein [Beijerinckiaceae bacterium]